MEHFWNRSREEQDTLRAWVEGRQGPPLLLAQQQREVERDRYAQQRRTSACPSCVGRGVAYIVGRAHKTAPVLGVSVPCSVCRPDDYAQRLADLHASCDP